MDNIEDILLFSERMQNSHLTDFWELSYYLIGWTIRNMRSKYENACDEFSPSRFYEKQMAFINDWPMDVKWKNFEESTDM